MAEKRPAEQPAQPADWDAGSYKPGAHSVQDGEPAAEKDPGWHGEQVVELNAPVPGEYRPAAQAVQAGAPLPL